MKKILFVAAACILAAACKPTETETTTASLEVTPTSLSFAAEDTAPQTITVTAVGVEWTYTLSESGKEWVTIDRQSEGELTVAVAENTKAEQRTASITFRAKDNNRIKDRSVTILQQGTDNPELYTLTVDPAALAFVAEGAEAQSVKVTAAGKGITWSAAVDEAAREWITLSSAEGAEGETMLAVTVADNPDTAERAANITLTPSEETAGSKVIRVTQEPRVLPPSFSMSYNGGEIPEEGFVIDYTGRTGYRIDISSCNLEWSVDIKYDTEESGWREAAKYIGEEASTINIRTATDNGRNESSAARTAYVSVTTNAEGIGPFEIKVTQEGKPDFLSSLEEDVDFGVLTHGFAVIRPNRPDGRDKPSTSWDLRLWSDGIDFSLNNYPKYYTGSGDRLNLVLFTEPITANDDNIYYIPDGTYTVVAYSDGDCDAGQIKGGAETRNYALPSGCWYIRMENDTHSGTACVKEGTATVTRNGEVYAISFHFTSDAEYSIEGSFEGVFDLHVE